MPPEPPGSPQEEDGQFLSKLVAVFFIFLLLTTLQSHMMIVIQHILVFSGKKASSSLLSQISVSIELQERAMQSDLKTNILHINRWMVTDIFVERFSPKRVHGSPFIIIIILFICLIYTIQKNLFTAVIASRRGDPGSHRAYGRAT